MLKIREAIVVEGRYDKNTLSQIVDAPILETSGFGIMKDKQQLNLLRRVAETRGLIVFTDSDGAGFIIRNYLKGTIPANQLKHAYIPDILGKERRKAAPGKEDRPGTPCSADNGFFVVVRRGAGDHRVRAHATEAVAGLAAKGVAFAGTVVADILLHRYYPLFQSGE